MRSHFSFASQVWTPRSVIKNLLLIERTQRRATKYMNYQIRIVHLNLLPLNYWLEYLNLLFFYKCKLEVIQLNLEIMLSTVTVNHVLVPLELILELHFLS